jgi:hypothetical protein
LALIEIGIPEVRGVINEDDVVLIIAGKDSAELVKKRAAVVVVRRLVQLRRWPPRVVSVEEKEGRAGILLCQIYTHINTDIQDRHSQKSMPSLMYC